MRHPTVLGIGINDADYPVGQGKCLYYSTWLSMLNRCYSRRVHQISPGYIGCSVVPEWHVFSVFKSWMQSKNWQGKVLDKDLLVPGNRIYGPSTCIFVSRRVNSLLNTQSTQRSDLPIGVARAYGRYKVTVKKDKITQHLGMFDTIDDAASAYKIAKAEWIEYQSTLENDPIVKAVLLQATAQLRKEAQ